MLSTLLASCLSFYSGYCRSFLELCIFRVLLGIALGLFGPAATSLTMEISPPSARVRLTIATIGGAAVAGRVLLAMLIYTVDTYLGYHIYVTSWRGLVVLTSTFSLVGLTLAAYNLAESPAWMLANSMPDEAAAAVPAHAQDNGRERALPEGRRLLLAGGGGGAEPHAGGGAARDLWLSMHLVLDDLSHLSQARIMMMMMMMMMMMVMVMMMMMMKMMTMTKMITMTMAMDTAFVA